MCINESPIKEKAEKESERRGKNCTDWAQSISDKYDKNIPHWWTVLKMFK